MRECKQVDYAYYTYVFGEFGVFFRGLIKNDRFNSHKKEMNIFRTIFFMGIRMAILNETTA